MVADVIAGNFGERASTCPVAAFLQTTSSKRLWPGMSPVGTSVATIARRWSGPMIAMNSVVVWWTFQIVVSPEDVSLIAAISPGMASIA